MSTFVLKQFPGMRGDEDYSYVSLAQQERHLLHLERQKTERIRNQICKKYHDPIERLLDPTAPELAYELPVSTYSDYSIVVEVAATTTQSSTTSAVAPSLPVALEMIPAPVPVGSISRACRSLGRCCSVYHMLHRTLQAWTCIHNILFPRIYFRGRDLRCNPGST